MNGKLSITAISDAYLGGLNLQRRPPDLDFLRELVSRHVANFSFSSVGPLLGNELPLDVDALYRRIVVNHRGGYCFEQNGLMQAILAELGYRVTLCLARVIFVHDNHPGLTHRITLVELNNTTYVTDVGFGAMGPRFPVAMTGEESRENFRVFRIAEGRTGEFHMQTKKDGAFHSLYRFELHRYGQSDCELGHFWSHRHPGANFVNNLVVARILADEIRSLRNRELWLIKAGGEERLTITDGRQLREALHHHFDIRVDEAEAMLLFERSAGPVVTNTTVSVSA